MDEQGYWKPSRWVYVGMAVGAILWVLFLTAITASALPAQEVEVRHYVGEIVALDNGNLFQPHVMVGRDGRAAAVVMVGPPGTQPQGGAAAGPITHTEEGDGIVAFCFVVDEVEGVAPEAMIGRTSCYVWLQEPDEMYETGGVPWGEATTGRMKWCEEEHALAPNSTLRPKEQRT
jgi:hypothetical protein